MNKNKYESQHKWQDKKGLIPKTYKLNKDIVEKFKEACDMNGVSQASTISELMNVYIEKTLKEHED